MSRPRKYLGGSKIISVSLDEEIIRTLDSMEYPTNRSAYINRLIKQDLKNQGRI